MTAAAKHLVVLRQAAILAAVPDLPAVATQVLRAATVDVLRHHPADATPVAMSRLHAVVMQLLAAKKRAAADFCPVCLAARNLADQAAIADVLLLPADALQVATADVLLRVVLRQHATADVLLPAVLQQHATADVLHLADVTVAVLMPVHLRAAKNEAACWPVCSAARSLATLVHLADVTAVANQPADATADVLLLRVELLLHAAEADVRRFNPLHLS